MGTETAYWEAVVAVAPLLALAAIVELRLTKWHRFSPFTRWTVGFLAGVVLLALGNAVYTALSVLREWDPSVPISQYRRQSTYWSVYFGIAGVIVYPVSQLWTVVFADIYLFPHIWKIQHGVRVGKRQERVFAKAIGDLKRQRQRVSEYIYERVLSHPDGTYAATPDGGYRLQIVDQRVMDLRALARQYDDSIAGAENELRKWKKSRAKRWKRYLKAIGTPSQKVTKILTSYQGVWK